MKRALAILGWLGFALVAAAVILRFTKPEWPGATQNLAIAGLVVTVIYALSQWRDIGRSFEGRNVRYGSIAAGSVLVFVAILVAVNWLASRQNKRWDLTESKQFSLSDQTKQILANLKSPLAVRVFHGSQDSPQRYRDRFTEYEYNSKQISVEYINAEGKPAEAEKYEITAVPTIVMEYGGRTQRATSVDESAITNALKKLIEGKTKKAYFLQGHGERDTDDASSPRGFKAASGALADENFESAKLTLAQAGSIPADATLLIVAGATTDVLPQEAELITAFLKNGGKLMLLIDPQDKDGKAQPQSLIALAKAWGIQVNDDIVVDPSPIGRTIGTDASVPIGMPTSHPITANFRVITAFPLTRSVTAVEGGTDGKFAQTFVQTGEQSWAESDVKGLYTTQRPEKNTDKGDKAGPISVAAAVSAPAAATPPPPPPGDKPATDKPAEDAPKAESRLAVIGDSDFASNRWMALGGNSDLFLNTANWLAQQEDLIAIRPRDPEDRRVELTEDQQTRILWITLVIIPLALFANAFRVVLEATVMRGGRSFLILLVVALGLGGYIYFYEWNREPSELASAKKDKVFDSDSSKFEEVEVRAVSGEVTTLKKVNGLWEISQPESLPTDSGEIGSLLSTLDTLEIQRVIDEHPANPAEFGLAPARFSVAFKVTGEPAMKRLEIGRKTPTGSDLYARVEGQPKVFLISAYLEDSLNKTPFGLRDKTALKFDRDAADALTLEVTGSPTLSFAKKGQDWRFTKPYDAKADFGIVDGVVSKLSSARMTAIDAADGTKDLKKYGLDKPQAVATIGVGSTQARLAVGSKKADGALYARDLARPMVFTVDATLLDDLKKKPDDLRKKDVFEFRPFSALGVDVTLGGTTFTFTKQKAPAATDPAAPAAPDVWKQTKPDAKDLDQSKITDFLTTMSNLRAESFATSALSSGEELVLTVRFGDEKAPSSEIVRFRKTGSAAHATLAGESSALVVSTIEYDKALSLIKALTGVK